MLCLFLNCALLVHVIDRYTKALEAIKKLHKEQAQEIKTYKLKLENLQTLKDAAFKVFFSFSFPRKLLMLLSEYSPFEAIYVRDYVKVLYICRLDN